MPIPNIGKYLKSNGVPWWSSKLVQSFLKDYFTKFINSYDFISTSNTTELYANLNLNNNHLDGIKVLPVSYLKIENNPDGNILPLASTYTKEDAQVYFDLNSLVCDIMDVTEHIYDYDFGNSTLDMQNDDYTHNNRCPLIGAALPWFVTYLNN